MSDSLAISVIGGGAWGTALAIVLARKGVTTRLWAREPEVAQDIVERRENRMFLRGVELPDSLDATTDLEVAMGAADVVVSAVPTQHIRSTLGGERKLLAEADIVITVSKGIELDTLATPNEIFNDLGVRAERVVALSGPSFAAEVAAELPTAVTVAGAGRPQVNLARDLFSTPRFRVYSSSDIISVELGGALKNVIAIAAGISDGLGLGYNTRTALITRGLAEITRLGEARGGNPLTFAGLSGMGDLVLTCTGDLSRNRSVGLAIGAGATLDDILARTDEVTEGVYTSLAARELGRRVGVEMPITHEVCAVLHENKDPQQAVLDLMGRQPREERWT